jgi:hypothetical protein
LRVVGHAHPDASLETRETVQRIAAELGYRASATARALRRGADHGRGVPRDGPVQAAEALDITPDEPWGTDIALAVGDAGLEDLAGNSLRRVFDR